MTGWHRNADDRVINTLSALAPVLP